MMKPETGHDESTDARESARGVIRRWGWNGTAYQILNPGFTLWLDPLLDAAVGYVERYGVRVVGGAPVCADKHLPAVVAAFESDAARAGCGVVYFCAEERIAQLGTRDPRRVTFPIGAQPTWTPADLLRAFDSHASLRAQLHRARNKGVAVRPVTTPDARLAGSLQQLLTGWLGDRGLPGLHFLIESQTLDDLHDRRLLVAERAGRPVAFLVATPIPARSGWLVEQLVRDRAAPNGTAEMLVHAAASALAHERAHMITLGLAPLARRATPLVDDAPAWVRALLRALRAGGRRFYNFEGLEAFKAKYDGAQWAPVYASLAPGTRMSVALLAITSAFAGESLVRFVPRVLLRAVTGGTHSS